MPTIQGQTKFVPVDQDQDDDVESVGLEETQCSEERKYTTVNTKNDLEREKQSVSAVGFFFTHDLETLGIGFWAKRRTLSRLE